MKLYKAEDLPKFTTVKQLSDAWLVEHNGDKKEALFSLDFQYNGMCYPTKTTTKNYELMRKHFTQ